MPPLTDDRRSDLERDLASALDRSRVSTRRIDRIAFANDASVYRQVPRAVVFPESTDEVAAVLRTTQRHGVPLTFRAAGTSLSGQAVTDGVLAVLSRNWRKVEVEQGGDRVRVQPGVLGGVVNQHLRSHGKKIGPDPASINACMIGGILANNSSGMCCGVVNNAYHTLESMIFVLPDATRVDSGEPDADRRLTEQAPQLVRGLLDIKRRVVGNPRLVERIRHKYRLKNTMGYSLNALIDFDRPVEILSHLMIGSEGTLGFIAEAVLRTIPDHPVKYTGLLFFGDVRSACAAIAALRDSGAEALELMDRASLRAVELEPGMPPSMRDLSPQAAALLVEYQCRDESELAERQRACDALLPALPLEQPAEFTRDEERQAALWRVRKGLIPSVGAMRAQGTSFIIEDVVFPVERLAEGVAELQALCARFGYDDAIVFGHAKDGNLHFVLTQAFGNADDVARYDGFMQELAGLVASRYGGSLKAEHGTGRNMAPFVAREWGEEAYAVMREIKRILDPGGLLNPGVILSDDPQAHVRHLKDIPRVEHEVDRCIECGFCERMCPSRDLTLTPRQRIVVHREIARLREQSPASAELRELEADFDYEALDTCAVDGLCALACPVSIDTGSLTRRLRGEGHAGAAHELARMAADRFAVVERAARVALRTGHLFRTVLGEKALVALTEGLRRATGQRLPAWEHGMPRAASGSFRTVDRAEARAVYFPSCVSRVLGAPPGVEDESLLRVLPAVSARAGIPVRMPDPVAGLCCGMPFSSRGFQEAHRLAVNRTVEALWDCTDRGRLPVVIDTSPCAFTLTQSSELLTPRNRRCHRELTILDSVEFAHDRILPNLSPRRMPGTVAVHPVCSVQKMQLSGKLQRVVEACSGGAFVPIHAGCCGFAGDRGFRFPELTAAATRDEAAELGNERFEGYYSSSRTCEIGLSRSTGRPYRSFWHLLDEATRPDAISRGT